MGSEAEYHGVDVHGKAVFLYSIPTPSALDHSAEWNGSLKRAIDKGAAGDFIVFAAR